MYCRYQDIIDAVYRDPASALGVEERLLSPELMHILKVHSEAVARKAVAVCKAHPELGADEDLVYAGAMLHDVGIVKCDAPGIHCFGTEPYIKHGVIGAEMLNDEKLARICARHTGTGLPGLEPETIEEDVF